MSDKLTASEALYGFVGWLSSREQMVIASRMHDASQWVGLIQAFCDSHDLDEPRDDWTENLNPDAVREYDRSI